MGTLLNELRVKNAQLMLTEQVFVVAGVLSLPSIRQRYEPVMERIPSATHEEHHPWKASQEMTRCVLVDMLIETSE